MATNYENEMAALKSDLSSLKNDFATLTRSVTDDARKNAKAFKDKASKKGHETREKAETTVSENPLTSLAIAAGISLVLGALMSKK